MQTPSVSPDLYALVGLFYSQPSQLGAFEEIQPDDMPTAQRSLLNHNEHMTVTVEKKHGSLVDVRVLDKQVSKEHYSRKILLTRQSDGTVVQFGIVRLHLSHLAPAVRREIESEQTPLGRVLIERNVFRQVQLSSLWRIEPGEDLRRYFQLDSSQVVFGRTALIYCDGEAAIELLEVVTP